VKDIEILTKNEIDVESALELLGDMEMYDEMLQDFLDECEERMPKVEEYYQNGDMKNYAILVHAMKGDSKYLGFTKLAEISLEHQLKSQENDLEYIKKYYNEWLQEVRRVLRVVQDYLSSSL